MLIKSTDNLGSNNIKMLVYGPPGVGKTSLVATCSGKACVISAEGGLLSLAGKGIDFIDINSNDAGELIMDKGLRLARLKQACAFLDSKEARAKYKWIFIDSITEIAQLYVEECKLEFPDAKNAFQLWGAYGDRMRNFIKFVRDIPEYNCVFTCLSTIEKDENGKRINSIDVQGKIGDALPGYMDEVFFYHVGEVDGVKIRKLVTQPSDKIIAKDRSGKLDAFEDPDLTKIAAKIHGVKKEEPRPLIRKLNQEVTV